MKRALVMQPAFIGDAICSVALANTLATIDPEFEISYLVRPESASLLSYAPNIHRVFAFDKYGEDSGIKGIEAKAAELNSVGFDVVFCLHRSRRTIELVKRLNVPMKVGIVPSPVFTHVIPAEKTDDAPTSAARLARTLSSNADITALPTLRLPSTLLPPEFSQLPRPIIGIAPGSVWKTKRWPARHVASLIQLLSSRAGSIVLIGQKTDVDSEIINPVSTYDVKLISYLSKLSLEASAAVISHLDVLVSNDSAPVHIAVAVGTPVVDVLGPTVKEFGFAPRPASGIVAECEGLWCRPCASHGSNECPIHTFDCMNKIDPAVVLARTLEYVAR
ncbi:MAG: glycosyltransferase family 9 protein [Bacteroidetes bacterium]|nr:glycosyltransferase family 9 protein [Bacteroidota bacterium]